MLDAIRRLAREGMSMIVVTHEMGFAREVGDQLVFMDEGLIVEQGSPREMLTSPRVSLARRSSSRRCCDGPGRAHDDAERLPRNVVVLSWVSFFQDAASEMLYPVMPLFLTSVLGAPVAVVGLVEGLGEAVASVMKIVSGRLADMRARDRSSCWAMDSRRWRSR